MKHAPVMKFTCKQSIYVLCQCLTIILNALCVPRALTSSTYMPSVRLLTSMVVLWRAAGRGEAGRVDRAAGDSVARLYHLFVTRRG